MVENDATPGLLQKLALRPGLEALSCKIPFPPDAHCSILREVGLGAFSALQDLDLQAPAGFVLALSKRLPRLRILNIRLEWPIETHLSEVNKFMSRLKLPSCLEELSVEYNYPNEFDFEEDPTIRKPAFYGMDLVCIGRRCPSLRILKLDTWLDGPSLDFSTLSDEHVMEFAGHARSIEVMKFGREMTSSSAYLTATCLETLGELCRRLKYLCIPMEIDLSQLQFPEPLFPKLVYFNCFRIHNNHGLRRAILQHFPNLVVKDERFGHIRTLHSYADAALWVTNGNILM